MLVLVTFEGSQPIGRLVPFGPQLGEPDLNVPDKLDVIAQFEAAHQPPTADIGIAHLSIQGGQLL